MGGGLHVVRGERTGGSEDRGQEQHKKHPNQKGSSKLPLSTDDMSKHPEDLSAINLLELKLRKL